MAFLEVRDIKKQYNNAPLLAGVSFEVAQGDIACLLGASGSGKTTLLRIIAGLEAAEGGSVWLAQADLTHAPVHQRGVVLMFQDFALFPHRTVAENVAFGLHMQKGHTKVAIKKRVSEMLALVGMDAFGHRNVIDLSGGERQRVALARSLAPNPHLLLLDEPLGALDRNLRERLLEELPVILRQVGVTTITVTHDQEEAFALADQVIILHDGIVAQQGTPETVYWSPATPWVADFLGLDNLIPAEVCGEQEVSTAMGPFVVNTSLPGTGARGFLLVYPTALRIDTLSQPLVNVFTGRIAQLSFHGHIHTITLDINGTLIRTLHTGPCHCAKGDRVQGWLDPRYLLWLPEGEGKR